MSKLADALKQISNWMKQSNPLPVIDGLEIPFRPGLSDKEIDKLTNFLPFKLP